MKKYFVVFVTFFTIGLSQAHAGNYGKGGENAAQYVREQIPELRYDIESVEATAEDSLLTDRMLALGQVQFAKAGTNFWQDKITKEQYQYIVDSTANALQDVQDSWIYGAVVNDSLRRVNKYRYNWAKVYTVTVKMKSGVTKTVRVLMDKDGETPRMTEKQFEQRLRGYSDRIIEAQRDINTNY